MDRQWSAYHMIHKGMEILAAQFINLGLRLLSGHLSVEELVAEPGNMLAWVWQVMVLERALENGVKDGRSGRHYTPNA
ncbi:hypothetical protein E4U42_003184 [Claviceps africana]|uniref:Uncharacterized protein n=1 Tax=Claviceps africana TaxID=83212 RepID=A0A8K0NLS0_9HYPO|nr:hypothetical protein E4U42_003184 [Claviceps africana]